LLTKLELILLFQFAHTVHIHRQFNKPKLKHNLRGITFPVRLRVSDSWVPAEFTYE